jgi:hypothetical protein
MEHEAHISLRVIDFGPDPGVVTKAAGFEPTEMWTKGQPMRKSPRVCHTHSRWTFKSPLPLSAPVEDHLTALVKALEAHAEGVRELSSKFSAFISLAIYFHTANPGFHISEALAERITALGLGMDFDLYCRCEEPAEGGAELGAPPNGGSAELFGNSGAGGEPPSVS